MSFQRVNGHISKSKFHVHHALSSDHTVIVFQAKAACVMSASKYTDVESGSYKNNPYVSCPAGTKLVGCTGYSP